MICTFLSMAIYSDIKFLLDSTLVERKSLKYLNVISTILFSIGFIIEHFTPKIEYITFVLFIFFVLTHVITKRYNIVKSI